MKRPLPEWDAGLDDVFHCVAIRPVTRDVATVVLAPRTAGTVQFEAGQYVTIEFAVDGRAVSRCYTIASPPTRPERLAITVGRSDSGAVSPWLHAGGLSVGSTVHVGAPQGEFTLGRHPATSLLFLTAGSGITPALSVLREASDLGTDLDVVLVHSQRRAADVPYRRELELITAALPRARLHLACTEADAQEVAGRLDVDRLATLVPDVANREVFVCGPGGYRTDAIAAARALGAARTRVHEESFTFAATAALPPSGAAPSGGFRIEFVDHAVTVECPAHTSILDAAVSAGLTLPSSCTQGICGTCKSTLLAGQVDMRHAGGIRAREIAAGKVLLCCSTPCSDVVIGR